MGQPVGWKKVVGSLAVGKTRRRQKERVSSEMLKAVETRMHKDNVCKLTSVAYLLTEMEANRKIKKLK